MAAIIWNITTGLPITFTSPAGTASLIIRGSSIPSNAVITKATLTLNGRVYGPAAAGSGYITIDGTSQGTYYDATSDGITLFQPSAYNWGVKPNQSNVSLKINGTYTTIYGAELKIEYINKYLITGYHSTGGDVYIGTSVTATDFTTLTVDMNQRVYLKCVPAFGYECKGWSVSRICNTSGTEDKSSGWIDTAGDTVIYGVFEKSVGNPVTFNASGGILVGDWGVDVGKTSSTISVPYMSNKYSMVGLAGKTGYIFNGWFSAADGGIQVYDKLGICTSDPNYWSGDCWICKNSVILYAQYVPVTYYIKYNGNGSTSGQMSNSVCRYDSISKLKSNMYKKLGYIFKYWTDNEGNTYYDESFVMNLSDTDSDVVNIYAQWEIDESGEESRQELMANYNKMSAANIKKTINDDNNVVTLIQSGTDDGYRIRVVDPDSVTTYDIFTVSPVSSDNKSIIKSVDISLKKDGNNLNLVTINRYSGFYNPIFKDMLFFNNYNSECKYSNTSFDDEYTDDYGSFGTINNMWFHKVNDEKPNIINSLEPYYPLTGQYALDHRKYNMFSTNWDINYFTKQIDINNKKTCENTAGMKEYPCMFGSRYLNVPEKIEIECFDGGQEIITNPEKYWNDDWINNQDLCPGEVMYKEINSNSVNYYFFLHKRIVRFFHDKLKPEFEKYINPDYSYGVSGLDDDIDAYITKNILNLYELKKIRVFVKRYKKGVHNSRIENDYGRNLNKSVLELKVDGFSEISNVTLSNVGSDNFDRKLVYNLRNGEQEDFGFSFIIKKI